MNLSTRLMELGLTLPAAPVPVAAYVPGKVTGNLLHISGQLPIRDGALLARGVVGTDIGVDEAQQAARQCVLNGLAVADGVLDGDWSRFEAVVRVGVFVASGPDFDQQHVVANGASDLLVEIFGDAGRHVRAAVGASSLPLGAAVEVELTLAVGGGDKS